MREGRQEQGRSLVRTYFPQDDFRRRVAERPRGKLPRGVDIFGHIFSAYVRPRRLKSSGVPLGRISSCLEKRDGAWKERGREREKEKEKRKAYEEEKDERAAKAGSDMERERDA